MRIYLSGPMRGLKHYNFPLFDRAAMDARLMGYEVVSPAELDRASGFDAMLLPEDRDWKTLPQNFDRWEALRRDLAILRTCDGICMLPGWQDSQGAHTELDLALHLGLKVLGYWQGDGVVQSAICPLDVGPSLSGASAPGK